MPSHTPSRRAHHLSWPCPCHRHLLVFAGHPHPDDGPDRAAVSETLHRGSVRMTALTRPTSQPSCASASADRAQGQPAHLRHLRLLLPVAGLLRRSPPGDQAETARGGAPRRASCARLFSNILSATGATLPYSATPGSPRSTPSSDTWNIDLHPVLTNLARSSRHSDEEDR